MAVKLLQYAENTPLPFKQDFAHQNKFASQRISEFCKVPEFADALKRFEDIQQSKIIAQAFIKAIDVTFAIFTLKNVAGWRDRQEVEHSGEIKGTAVQIIQFNDTRKTNSPSPEARISHFDTSVAAGDTSRV
jgi:hypothetical protein